MCNRPQTCHPPLPTRKAAQAENHWAAGPTEAGMDRNRNGSCRTWRETMRSPPRDSRSVHGHRRGSFSSDCTCSWHPGGGTRAGRSPLAAPPVWTPGVGVGGVLVPTQKEGVKGRETVGDAKGAKRERTLSIIDGEKKKKLQ